MFLKTDTDIPIDAFKKYPRFAKTMRNCGDPNRKSGVQGITIQSKTHGFRGSNLYQQQVPCMLDKQQIGLIFLRRESRNVARDALKQRRPQTIWVKSTVEFSIKAVTVARRVVEQCCPGKEKSWFIDSLTFMLHMISHDVQWFPPRFYLEKNTL